MSDNIFTGMHIVSLEDRIKILEAEKARLENEERAWKYLDGWRQLEIEKLEKIVEVAKENFYRINSLCMGCSYQIVMPTLTKIAELEKSDGRETKNG